MDSKIIKLYDAYTHSVINRQEFLSKLAGIAGGTAAAAAVLSILENNYAVAEIIAKDDPRLTIEHATYPGATGDMRVYTARPKSAGKLPGVIVIHENRGLNPHIEDVTRRMALEGFLAAAPDALSPAGGTPTNEDEARTQIGRLDRDSNLQNFIGAVSWLKSHAGSTGKIGCIGFCWGGGMANELAVHSPDLAAAVPFYGRQAATADVPKIKAALMLHYGALDTRINEGIPAYEAALKKHGVKHQIFIYEGANHAFHNDTSGPRYHKEAAELAWKRTIAFLKETLA